MLIFRDKNIAYMHVPKTSGKALRFVLNAIMNPSDVWWGTVDAWGAERTRFNKVDRAHYTAEMIANFHPDLWDELLGMKCFSVMRSPYSRAVSAYEQFKISFGRHGVVNRVRRLSDYLACIRDELYRRDRDGYLYIHGVPQVKFHLPGHRVISGNDLTGPLSEIFGQKVSFFSLERPCRGLSDMERRLVERVYEKDIEMWERSIQLQSTARTLKS